ncbi:MAG: fluoride efflux transporter CrcB [Fimbriimonadaceae bacterium]|nr:fluoride efflux transporter CrcB [Fimbriimonadaceae bacterium]
MGGLGASGLVFVGAGLGAVCRYWVGAVVGGRSFPWATLGVNVLGGLIIGLIISALPATSGARAFWVVGVLGGFTTFSAFSAEVVQMLASRSFGSAIWYVALSNLGAIGACAVGWWVATKLGL